MPDWPEYVRHHLRLSGFRPEREAEIIEEVARQMEDAYSEALRMGASDAQAGEIARRHISDWQALANALADAHHGKEPIMGAWQRQTEDREFDIRGRLSWFTGWRRESCLESRWARSWPFGWPSRSTNTISRSCCRVASSG